MKPLSPILFMARFFSALIASLLIVFSVTFPGDLRAETSPEIVPAASDASNVAASTIATPATRDAAPTPVPPPERRSRAASPAPLPPPAPGLGAWIGGTCGVLALLMGSVWGLARSYMSRWKVPQRIAAGFSMLLLVLALTGVAGYQGLHTAYEGFVAYRANARHSNLAANITTHYLEMRIAAKDLVIFKTQDPVKRYHDHQAALSDLLKNAETEIQEPEYLQRVRSMQTQLAAHVGLHGQLTEAVLAGKSTEASEINRRMGAVGSSITQDAEEMTHGFQAAQNRLGPLVKQRTEQTQIAILCICIAALVLGVFIAWLISRSIVGLLRLFADTLEDVAHQVTSASTQVSTASQSLAEGASEQAASLEETSASLEEMTSMVKRTADAAQQAKDLSAQTRVAADAGASDMQQMQQSMDAIKLSSSEVAKIVKNIDEIAFQTNILALNAAVEAARAGEAGAGFAVVADEVRNLAQRSATAAKETAEKIDDAIAKSNEGVRVSGKVSASLQEIITKARGVDTLVGEIATASREQAEGITQVNIAVTQMDKVTQSNAANAEESAAAAEQLSAQAASQNEAVNSLLSLIGRPNSSRVENVRKEPLSGSRPHSVQTAQPAQRTPSPAPPPTEPQSVNRQEIPMPAEDSFKNF